MYGVYTTVTNCAAHNAGYPYMMPAPSMMYASASPVGYYVMTGGVATNGNATVRASSVGTGEEEATKAEGDANAA